MIDVEQASSFVESRGTSVERARLQAIMDPSGPIAVGYQLVVGGQRFDGGFAPFWAENYSSIDATAFRLAQIRPFDPAGREAETQKALRFLARRQRNDGAFVEDQSVADAAPPWARPGDPTARLYLTSNAGSMLALYGWHTEASAASDFVMRALSGTDPASISAEVLWLGGALYCAEGDGRQAEALLKALAPRLPDLEAGALSWCLSSLRDAGFAADHPVLTRAWQLLSGCQRADGSFASQDGESYAVQATLEAIRAARFMRKAD